MPIDTGLSVPIFNVIKYVCVLIFIDTLVSRSLRTFQSLIRRYDLYCGRSVALESDRFDRYNLWSKLSMRRVYRLGFWVVLISCAYAAEIILEFSSDANTKLVSRSEQVNLYNATHRTCGSRDLFNRTATALVADLATKCIDLSDTQYTFYKPTWIYNGTVTPICTRTSDNILAVGEPPYITLDYQQDSEPHKRERSIVGSLRANSWKSNGDNSTAIITIPVTNHDVVAATVQQIGEYVYYSGVFFTQIPNTMTSCGGNVYGRFGEGQMRVTFLGCVHTSFSSGWDYTYLFGTGMVFKDVETLRTGDWTAFVGTDHGKTVVNFTQKVLDNPENGQVRSLATLLSIGPGRDIDSVNKYAIAYKHCEDYRVPLRDAFRLETFPRVRTEQVITVSVQEWALAIIIIWPMLIWLTALGFTHMANQKGLPTCVQGEKAIARRWLATRGKLKLTNDEALPSDDSNEEAKARSEFWKQVSQKCIAFKWNSSVYLTVKPGVDWDEIVISGKCIDVERDRLRPFEAV